MNKTMIPITITVLLLIFLVPAAHAGEWIEQPLGSYNWNRFAIGAEAVGVAEATSNSLLFFNARTSVWMEHELDTPMSVVTILADGFLVLVVGEDKAVAFNSMTSLVSELVYEGSLLSTSSSSKSYDCGSELAMVVTDQEFCVFDAEMDQWRRHAYSLMGTPNTVFRHQCHDFYAASFMYQSDTGDMLNIAYSLLHHDFDETYFGISCPLMPMKHGFAGVRAQYEAISYFVGYSAVTNSFDHVFVPDGMQTGGLAENWYHENIGTKTICVGWYWDNATSETTDYFNYGYDTRHGHWQHQLITTVSGESTFGGWKSGGTYCSNWFRHSGSDTYDLWVFDGTSNSFQVLSHNLDSSMFFQGGNVVVCSESDGATGVDLGSGEHSPNNNPYYGRHFPGLNCLSYLSEGPGEDEKTVNIYNGNHNTWHHHTTGPLDHEGWGTEHVQMRRFGDPQGEAIFYSAFRDEIYAMSLAGWPSTTPLISDNYAGVYRATEGVGALYDAHRGSVYSLNGFDSLTGGERYVMTLDSNTLEIKAYSLATGMWSYQTLENEGVLNWGPDLVGLAKSTNGYVYNVFYAYDASDDSWAVLHSTGVYVGLGAGERTALYLSTYNAYALGTGTISPVQLNSLSLQGGCGAVDVRWEGGFELTADEVRLTAQGPDGSSSRSWDVAVVREGANHFRALDNCPHLALGGLFNYTLEVAATEGQWVAMAAEKIYLQPAPLAEIRQIHPNPFNPNTSIEFYLTRPQVVELCVYDLAGRRVRVLVEETLEAGPHRLQWDGCDGSGRSLASGMYSVSLKTESVIDRRKVMLVR